MPGSARRRKREAGLVDRCDCRTERRPGGGDADAADPDRRSAGAMPASAVLPITGSSRLLSGDPLANRMPRDAFLQQVTFSVLGNASRTRLTAPRCPLLLKLPAGTFRARGGRCA